MALINCPECGKEVSDMAKSCPNCGNPINDEPIKVENTNYEEENKDGAGRALGIVLLVLGFGFALIKLFQMAM